MNAGRRRFPQTRWSLVLRAGGESTPASRKAMDELCRAYRAPLWDLACCLRRGPDGVDDLLQGFFLHLLEKDLVGSARSTLGQFRKLLKKALRNYANNVYDAETAHKRGGQARIIDVEPDELSSGAPTADDLCDQKWAATMTKRALEQLGDEQARIGKRALFEALRERLADDDGAPLRDVAAALGMSELAVRQALYRLRRRLAELVRAEVAETVAWPEDVDAELRDLRASWRRRKK